MKRLQLLALLFVLWGWAGTTQQPSLFSTAWRDRGVFRQGLIPAAQPAASLPGASIYHLELSLAEDLREISGRQEVYYRNRSVDVLNEIYFYLFPNLLDGELTVSELSVAGEPVTPRFELKRSVLRIDLQAPLLPGEEVVVKLAFRVTVPESFSRNFGLFAYQDGILSLAHAYPLLAVYDDEGWNLSIPPAYGDLVYAQSSFYLVRVLAPADLTIVTTGTELARQQNGEQQQLLIAAGPVRDFFLSASKDYDLQLSKLGDTTIRSYSLPGQEEASGQILEVAQAALTSFNRRFGDYPFREFDVVPLRTDALGIEFPGITALSLRLYEQEPINGVPVNVMLEATVVHELAHQWFYSLVGNDQVDEPWLDEALTQYATLLYYRDRYGSQGYAGFRRSLQDRWDRVNRERIPIGLPVEDYDSRSYGAIVYGLGPLVLEDLAGLMGQKTFDAFLRNYVESYGWDVASAEDFKALAEAFCACGLNSFFTDWIDGP